VRLELSLSGFCFTEINMLSFIKFKSQSDDRNYETSFWWEINIITTFLIWDAQQSVEQPRAAFESVPTIPPTVVQCCRECVISWIANCKPKNKCLKRKHGIFEESKNISTYTEWVWSESIVLVGVLNDGIAGIGSGGARR
jgi:hypothetical protein